jgi:hypothetical protein
MPNWCNNTITITGPKHKIELLWKNATQDADAETGLMNGMIPMPDALRETTSPDPQPGQSNYEGPQPVVDGFTNWYDWRVAKWGIKWDVSSEGLEYSEDGDTATITGWFDSPWGPPIEGIAAYTQANEDVYIECFYHEPGMAFVGCWDSDGGDDHYSYESANDIPDYLDEHFGISEQLEMWAEDELA